MTEAIKRDQSRIEQSGTTQERQHLYMTMPSAHYPNLLLVAVLSVCSLGHQTSVHIRNPDPEETSGELQQDQADAEHHLNWHCVAKRLWRDIEILRDEQFSRDFGDIKKMKAFSERIPMPSDGCLAKNFREQRCLRRIYSVLKVYKECLPYVEQANLTTALVMNINHTTNRLLHIITEKVNDAQVPQSFICESAEDSAWRRKIVTHSILYFYAPFMANTARVFRQIYRTEKTQHKEKDC